MQNSERLKDRLNEEAPLLGLWVSSGDAYCAEVCAGAGFDWLLFDAEHAPNDIRSLLAQLQAVAAYPSSPIVRPPCDDATITKRLLDIGATNFLFPMVDTPEQARGIVLSTRYPPRGLRGVGSSLARASRWNRVSDYLAHADDDVCVIVQVESVTGLENLTEIARVDGVDAVFIGAADLAASMGHLGDPANPVVRKAVDEAIDVLHELDVPVGALAFDDESAQRYIEGGCKLVAVGADLRILATGTDRLAARFRESSAR